MADNLLDDANAINQIQDVNRRLKGDKPVLDPIDRIRQGFQQLRVEDRTAPGYPGAFLYGGQNFGDFINPLGADMRFLNIPIDRPGEGGPRPAQRADLNNPLSMQLGIRSLIPNYQHRLYINSLGYGPLSQLGRR
jgi:hypothetical protein